MSVRTTTTRIVKRGGGVLEGAEKKWIVMKPSEEKAVKLVLEKRVTIKYATLDGTVAQGSVDGFNDVYEASYSPAGYVCTCPAGQNHRVCSHARALELEVHRRLERVAV